MQLKSSSAIVILARSSTMKRFAQKSVPAVKTSCYNYGLRYRSTLNPSLIPSLISYQSRMNELMLTVHLLADSVIYTLVIFAWFEAYWCFSGTKRSYIVFINPTRLSQWTTSRCSCCCPSLKFFFTAERTPMWTLKWRTAWTGWSPGSQKIRAPPRPYRTMAT